MKKPVLVIMAAGMGSRYGGLKQIDPVDDQGHIIMDFSIWDALEAGFEEVALIIKRENETDFRQAVGDRISRKIKVHYVYQQLEDIPEGFAVPSGRVKPWGTGHAVLSCIDQIDGPFAVINADDYYGKEAFRQIHDFLVQYTPEKSMDFCMAGFILKNTLSDNGSVTRGICRVNEAGYLTGVEETGNLVKDKEGAAVEEDGVRRPVDADSYVSMNMWGLTPEFLPRLAEGFREFFRNLEGRELKGEYLLPIFIDELLQAGEISVKVLETSDRWFGVTYQEDKDTVIGAFRKLIEEGVYRKDLFGDLLEKQA